MATEEFYADEAKAFVAKHPDFYATSDNRDALFDRLKAKGLGLDRRTLATVYEELKAEGKLKLAPAKEEAQSHAEGATD
jgi:hypothetical protein